MSRFFFTSYFSCFCILTPCSLAYRNGAQQESCYSHGVSHPSAFDPGRAGQICQGARSCSIPLVLIGEVNEANFSLVDTGVAKTRVLNCGSVYRCKLINYGSLIQSRPGRPWGSCLYTVKIIMFLHEHFTCYHWQCMGHNYITLADGN